MWRCCLHHSPSKFCQTDMWNNSRLRPYKLTHCTSSVLLLPPVYRLPSRTSDPQLAGLIQWMEKKKTWTSCQHESIRFGAGAPSIALPVNESISLYLLISVAHNHAGEVMPSTAGPLSYWPSRQAENTADRRTLDWRAVSRGRSKVSQGSNSRVRLSKNSPDGGSVRILLLESDNPAAEGRLSQTRQYKYELDNVAAHVLLFARHHAKWQQQSSSKDPPGSQNL